jgi:hypothetical protein
MLSIRVKVSPFDGSTRTVAPAAALEAGFCSSLANAASGIAKAASAITVIRASFMMDSFR